ncbi:MAG: T9SS type A sorting domain-containing protein [Sphingobacteriales bacterium JAD_PAG50586_3]|nr:MAG: T9SS type A sorting domain-containing protein [Sphingobacteriales bacterium JAD_PAG50586_3]
MKKLYVALALSFVGYTAYSQNLINDGGTINIAPGATVTLTANFNNLNAGAVNNSGAMEVAGNFTAADASNQTGAGIYRFNGNNNPQTLTIGTGQISSIELNNPLGLELQSDVKGVNSLNFINGHIISGPNTLTMNTVNNAVSGASNNRFLVCGDNGLLKYNNVGTGDTAFFPIGYSVGNYNPAWLTNSGTADNFSAQVFNDVLNNGLTGSSIAFDDRLVNRTWNIQEDNAGGTMPMLTLQWDASHQRAGFNPQVNSVVSYYRENQGQWEYFPSSVPVQGSDPFIITRTFTANPDNMGAFIVANNGSITIFPESVGETPPGTEVSCSPNPATTGNTIQVTAKALANKVVNVKLFDATGRCVATDNKMANPKGQLPFVIPQLTKGMYLLNLTTPQGRYSSKLIVE